MLEVSSNSKQIQQKEGSQWHIPFPGKKENDLYLQDPLVVPNLMKFRDYPW